LESAGWTPQAIDEIENDHRTMMRAYREEPPFKAAVDKCSDARTHFHAGWAHCDNRFPGLQAYCGGLASVFQNTGSVESDVSVIGWEKDEYRQSLTDFSLESTLHAKQFDYIRGI
jgi:hypothetical protein